MLPDVVQDTGNGTASVRFVLVAAGQSAVDIYVTAPAVLIDNIDPTISFLGYGNSGGYTSFPEGSYRTRITVAGTKSIIYDSGVFTLAAHSVSNAIIYTRGSDLLVNVMLLDTAGGTVIANNTLSTVRAMNTSPGMGNVDLLVGTPPLSSGSRVRGGVELHPRSDRHRRYSPSRRARRRARSSRRRRPRSTAATDNTVLLLGFPGAQTVKVFPDDNLPLPSNFEKVRFINASRDAPPLDVLINDVKTNHRACLRNGVGRCPAAGRHVHLQIRRSGDRQRSARR